MLSTTDKERTYILETYSYGFQHTDILVLVEQQRLTFISLESLVV